MSSRECVYHDNYRIPERESPFLQVWDESEVEPGRSSDMSKVRLFFRSGFFSLFSKRSFGKIKVFTKIVERRKCVGNYFFEIGIDETNGC
jgi:hypothetical protein